MAEPLRVDPARFVDAETLREWHVRLDARGLRATASPAHEEYVTDLVRRIAALGLEVQSDEVPVRRWTPWSWSLRTDGEEVRVCSYVPYSGSTGSGGVSGPLSVAPRTCASGEIVIMDVPVQPLQEADFAALDWDAPDQPLIPADRDLSAPYHRVWLSQPAMREGLAELKKAGAAGAILVIDAPTAALDNSYLLYDGILRDLPALVVDRATGDRLKTLAASGRSATLVLQADVVDATSRNIYAVIPGATDELLLVQSHTDGTNALEDNGTEAILAMADYLTRLPRRDLARGFLLVLSSGHFVTHTAWGLADFIRRHRHDLIERTVAALSFEHLGALAWRTGPDGYVVPGEHELGCFFASPHRAMINVVRRALERAQVTDPLVLRPFMRDETGESQDGLGWPGDGTPLWNIGHLPSANFITGPDYALAARPVMDLIDIGAVRRQCVAFLDAALEISSLSCSELATRVDEASSE